jgi:sulfite reductase (NADPH) flavoprotein alpha-component
MQIPENAPFTPDERAKFNSILAALNPTQQTWVKGFFSGLVASTSPSGVAAPSQATTELTILFGTESGNCEELADRTKKLAAKSGFKPRVVNMSETDTKKLSTSKNLVVIVSTWGDGDPPDAATGFYKELMGDGAAKFKDTRFSVLALGDTSYEKFCEIGKNVDRRLEELGAQRVYNRVDCDVNFEANWESWSSGVLKAFPSATVEKGTSAKPEATLASEGFGKKNPFPAILEEKILLNGTGSAKETLHLELNLAGSGLQYEVGDALAIVPTNRDQDVEWVLQASGLSANTKFGDKTLAEALKHDFDITSLTSRIAGKYNEIAKDSKLTTLLDPENKKQFAEWSYGRQFVDLLEEFPCKSLTAESLTGLLRGMAPRLYSIASSPKAHENEVHLTIAAVRYHTHGKARVGVASTYTADLVEKGDKIPVYVHSNKNFRLPADPATAIIMIGPGTGIAPFRAFVEERQAIGATGKNWLFFGDQHYSYDFLYQLEWQNFLKEGILHRLDVAFSRDQPEKVYVQHKLLQAAGEVYQWIANGAYVYVCGDANRMAHDVNAALIEIIAKQGGKSPEEAEAYLTEMKKAKRYQRDVY